MRGRDLILKTGGFKLSLTAQVQALFAGRVGGMWDYGDTSTLFQDAATPVTAVTQPIGMVLDKSRGLALGAEAVPSINWNGGYTTNGAKQIPTGWIEWDPTHIVSATVLPNSFKFTANQHSAGIELSAPATSVVGKFNKYVIRARKTAFISGNPLLQVYTGVWWEIVPISAVVGDWYTKTIYASAIYAVVINNASGAAEWEVEYLSVKELPGNHATQPTAGSRSLYQVVGGYGCAQFDGVNDYLSCGSVDFSATDKVTVVAAMTLASSGGSYGLVGHGNNSAGNFNVGFFTFGASWRASLFGSTGNARTRINAADFPAVPHTRVLTVEFDLAGAASTDEAKVRLNGATVIIDDFSGTPAGGGNLANATLEIGRCQGTFVFNGNIHRLVVIGGGLSAAERRVVETYAAEGNGQTIP